MQPWGKLKFKINTSKYGTRYYSRYVCSSEHSSNYYGDNSSDVWGNNNIKRSTHNSSKHAEAYAGNNLTVNDADDSSQNESNNKYNKSTRFSTNHNLNYSEEVYVVNIGDRDTHNGDNNTSVYSPHNSSYCSGNGWFITI